MRNGRSITLLLLAVALLLFAHVAVRTGDAGRRSERRQTLVERRDGVDALEIRRKGCVTLVIRRGEEPGWRIVEPFSGRADEQSVARLIDVLSDAPVADVVADAELVRLGKTRADFSLEEPLVSVTIGAGKARDVVSFGMPTPAADGVYATVDGIAAVFVVPSEVLSAVDRPLTEFRRRNLFAVGMESVSSFVLRQGMGVNLSFVREGDDWKVDGERASRARVESFLSGLLSARAEGFFWPVGASNEAERASASLLAGYGLEPEGAVTVTLKGIDGEDRQVAFGKAADPGLVYASVQNGRAVVSVKDSLKAEALQKRNVFTDSRLFPVDESSVGTIRLVDGGETCVLARTETGSWRLEAPVSAPADSVVVGRVLARILALPVTCSASGEGDFRVSVSASTAPVCVPKALVLGDGRIDDFRSVEMLSVDPKDVRRLVFSSGERGVSAVSVVRNREDGSWSVESAEGAAAGARIEGIGAVLSALSPLRAVRVERLRVSAADLDGYGLGRPFLTVAVDLDRENAVRRNVLVGEKTRGGRFATVGSSDAVFVISDGTVERLTSEPIAR